MSYFISMDYCVAFEWVVEKCSNARLRFAAENERPPMTSQEPTSGSLRRIHLYGLCPCTP